MISMIKNWKGKVEIDGVVYDNVQSAIVNFKPTSDIHIVLKSGAEEHKKVEVSAVADVQEYRITVKPYMTRHSSPEFDFMAKFNNDNPMPMRIMTGTIEKETRGMVYMHLHGEARETITCVCCGKELTNPVSRHYGIGPICMGKVGIVADINAIDEIKEKLVNVKWSGWVIKSAIISKEEV